MGEKVNSSQRRIMFSSGIYSAEAVRLAAYVFSDRAGIKLTTGGGGTEALCEEEFAGEFSNEVLNQQCRLDLAANNGKIAGMIVTKALLSASGETGKDGGK